MAGSSAPGTPDRLLLHVLAAHEQAHRAHLGVDGRTPGGDRRRDRLLDRVRPVEEPVQARPAATPADVDPAEADRFDVLLVEPRQPGVVAVEVVARAVQAGVLEPQLDVRRRVEQLALHDEGVAVLGEPAAEPLLPRDAPGDHPVREHLAPATRRRGGPARCGRCARRPGRPAGRSRGRPAGRRWPARSRTAGWTRSGRTAPPPPARGASRRARRGCRTPLSSALRRVIRRARSLTSVATTVSQWSARCRAWTPQPVPRSSARAHRLADRQLGQRGRGGTDAEDVVGAHPVRAAVEAGGQVADHPQVPVAGGVRADVEARHHLARRVLEDALGRQLLDQARERALGVRHRDRRLEQEQPDQRLERAAARRTPEAGHRLVAGQCVVGPRAEHLGHAVVGEPGAGECLPQAHGQVGGRHASNPRARVAGGEPRTPAARRWLNP